MNLDTFFPEVFSDSMLGQVFNCELSWFRQNCQKYNSFQTNPDLRAGQIFAKGCELTRKAFYLEKLPLREAIEVGETYIAEAEDTQHQEKSNILIARRFRKYFETFPLDGEFRPVKLENGEYAIEYKFEINLPILHPETNKPLVFKCILDTIEEQSLPGGRIRTILNDEKTTSKLSRVPFSVSPQYPNGIVDIEKETNKFRLSSQLLAYSWAAKTLGIKIDQAHIKRVPLGKEYEPAIRIDIDISEFSIDNWYSSILNKISHLTASYKVWKETSEIPQVYFKPSYKDDCVSSYGRLCPYLRGCTSKDGEEMLRQMYPQVVYDRENKIMIPLKEYKEKLGIL